jgi:hypothetical protein
MKRKGVDSLQFWFQTMLDPAKGWLEIQELTNKKTITTANLVEQTLAHSLPFTPNINL